MRKNNGDGEFRTHDLGIKRPQALPAGVRTETEPGGIVALSGLLPAPGVAHSAGHSPQKSPQVIHV